MNHLKFDNKTCRRLKSLISVFCLTAMVGCTSFNDVEVHSYAPFVIPDKGLAGEAYPFHVKDDVLSARYDVKISGCPVMAVQYNSNGNVDQGYCMDVARFSSNSLTPKVEILMKGDDTIHTVTVHPVRYYPQVSLTLSEDKKKLTFNLSEKLPYAIVAINGGDPQDATEKNPQLTLINDPLEQKENIPNCSDPNVLNFRAFAEEYLRKHPITDSIGDICRSAGSVTDTSLNDERLFTWNYDEGKFVSYADKKVAFPNKRARNANDVSDALQAALELIRITPELNTLYIPAGVYLWSGLRIVNWNGDVQKGGKPLYVYTEENALMINRLKECREALEPAIFIDHSSYVTISGRGVHDGQGCVTCFFDRKDARNTPHQGGSVIRHSNHIRFTDTYMRNSQQWNWETHSSEDVELNNIKGLSPYYHAWVDGLNLSSGKNITVNGSITLGNDDIFATGHYNPSDEFPRRTYRENPSINLQNTDANPAEIRHTFAAAGVYNKDRLSWSTIDSENIRVSNAIGWTRTAHCIRAGANTLIGNPEVAPRGRALKSYYFDNFHAVAGRNAGGDIRFQNDEQICYPSYEEIVIKNCSFWAPGNYWARIPTDIDKQHQIRNVILENLYFVKPVEKPFAEFSGIDSLVVRDLYFGGKLVKNITESDIPMKMDSVMVFRHGVK